MREVKVKRKTHETEIEIALNLDGQGKYDIKTKISFLDHMLAQLAKHGLFDLQLKARGDLDVDIHHTNEDIGIALGQAFKKALGSKAGLVRFGFAYSILDEAEARCVVDISGRAFLDINPLKKRLKGENYSFSYFHQFLRAFVHAAQISLHVDILKGDDFHHILESCFKALALSLRQACQKDKRKKGIPSTKGRIEA